VSRVRFAPGHQHHQPSEQGNGPRVPANAVLQGFRDSISVDVHLYEFVVPNVPSSSNERGRVPNLVVEPQAIAEHRRMSRSLRTEPRHRQAERRAPSLDRLRVRVHAPRPGFVHPAGRRDILQVFGVLGAWAWYGLQVVELRQREDADLVYGRMRAPGQIFLYEQPAGAPLRDFMRFDVLLHEIGHHLLQHRVRKVGSVRRHTDHERYADLFMSRWKPVVVRAVLGLPE
jgi:hypothetical protein